MTTKIFSFSLTSKFRAILNAHLQPFSYRTLKNPYIKNFCPDGYVLKILNSFDSKKSAFIEGQTALSLYLSKHE